MKYEEIKIGDVFTYRDFKETVISKSDRHRVITTIDNDSIYSAWTEKQLHRLKPLKEELPEEGLLVHENGSLVYKLNDNSGYGFDCGWQSLYYFNKLWTFSADSWRKATEQEEIKFIEMLKKECENRGLFEDTKIEMHADGSLLRDPSFMGRIPTFEITYARNKNGIIFYKGNFATPKKESTLELVSKATLDLSKFGVEIEQKGNVLIINPIKR